MEPRVLTGVSQRISQQKPPASTKAPLPPYDCHPYDTKDHSRCIYDRTNLRRIKSSPCRSGKASGNEKEKRRHRVSREREGRRQRVRARPLSVEDILRCRPLLPVGSTEARKPYSKIMATWFSARPLFFVSAASGRLRSTVELLR